MFRGWAKNTLAFLKNKSANVAITSAIAAVPLFGAVGLAVDYSVMSSSESKLQDAADATALATVLEMGLVTTKNADLNKAAEAFLMAQIEKTWGVGLDPKGVKVEAQPITGTSELEITASYVWKPFIMGFLVKSSNPIVKKSRARLTGDTNVCVVGLSTNQGKTVFLDGDATLTGNDCGIFSNSSHSESIRLDGSASIDAALVCSVGGARDNSAGAIKPSATTDCPPVADPLASRTEPSTAGCDFSDVDIKDQITTLNPGVYCGGLTISGNSVVTLNPGIYVVKNNKFLVQDNAEVNGTEVGIFLDKGNVEFEFTENTTVDLSAPESGPMAGILIFEARNGKAGNVHRIGSNDARNLVGTIYMPRGTFLVDARQPVANESAYTAIIARRIELTEKPNLVLNSDYDDTNVPVPDGLAGKKNAVLTK